MTYNVNPSLQPSIRSNPTGLTASDRMYLPAHMSVRFVHTAGGDTSKAPFVSLSIILFAFSLSLALTPQSHS